MILLAVGCLIYQSHLETRLADPADKSVVPVDELEAISQLPADEPCVLVMHRQSGNVHRGPVDLGRRLPPL